ncbi:MAG TPA: aa3-type cytochrome c oxidase subunit IV [Novosphingobium sp.]|nr:aa3-type cytochrome c oxidase subunit IV [Novosphingobium sp.]
MATTHDIEAARATYEGFLRLFRIGTPIVALIAALVLFLLTR